VLVLPAQPSAGQAFIPAAADGTVSVAFQSVRSAPQLDGTGAKGDPLETWDTQALIWHVEYGLTDKIAVHASLPFMMTRYEGSFAHSDYDDGTYHGAFQDFYLGVRYGVVQSPGFALAPFVEVVIPSHRYESRVQSAPGRDVRVLLVGAAVGGFLDGILPGLYYQTRISYGIAQDVVDIRPNRTGIDSAIGYFVNPRLGVQFVQTFQYAHNGMWFTFNPDFRADITGGGEITDEHWINHDRLLRARVLAFGGGMTYALTESVGLFATATTAAWGRSLPRPARAISVGVNWSFQMGRSSSRSNPNVNRPVRLQ
jgi:outer membrane putative beta-barrel porin/alpha-amylase